MPKRGIKKRILNKVNALFSIRATKHRLAIRGDHKELDCNSPKDTSTKTMDGVRRPATVVNKPRGIRFSRRAVQRSKYLREKFGVRKTVMGFSPRVGSITEEDENEITLWRLAENAENVISDSMAWLRNSEECNEDSAGMDQESHEKILQMWIKNNTFADNIYDDNDEYDDDDQGVYQDDNSDERQDIKDDDDKDVYLDDNSNEQHDITDDDDDQDSSCYDDSDDQIELAVEEDDDIQEIDEQWKSVDNIQQQQEHFSHDYDSSSEDDADDSEDYDDDRISVTQLMTDDYNSDTESRNDVDDDEDLARDRTNENRSCKIYVDGTTTIYYNDANRDGDDDKNQQSKSSHTDDYDDFVMGRTSDDDIPNNNFKDSIGCSNRNNKIDSISTIEKYIRSTREDFETSFDDNKSEGNDVSICNEYDSTVERAKILNIKHGEDDDDVSHDKSKHDNDDCDDDTNARQASILNSQHDDDDDLDINHNDDAFNASANLNIFTTDNAKSIIPDNNFDLRYFNDKIHQEQTTFTKIHPDKVCDTKTSNISEIEAKDDTVFKDDVLDTVREEIDEILTHISQIESDFNFMRKTMNDFRS